MYEKCDNVVVQVANGMILKVQGRGTVGPLTNCLHVEALVFCLVSESQLDRQLFRMESGGGIRTFKYHDGKIFLVAQLTHRNLYEIDTTYLGFLEQDRTPLEYSAILSKVEAIDKLHRTLGHVGVQRLEEFVKSGHVKWETATAPTSFKRWASTCPACAMAKSKRLPHTGHLHTPLQAGALWYVDVWGPAETPALNSTNVYSFGFVDAFSRRL